MAVTSGIAKPSRMYSGRASQWALSAASHAGAVGERFSDAGAAAARRLSAGLGALQARARAQGASLAQTARGASGLLVPTAAAAAFAYAFTTSWARAVEVCAWALACSLLLSLRSALRRQEQVLLQLAELKQSLHVTQALLQVEELEGAEEIDEEAEAAAQDEPASLPGRLGSLRRRLRRAARR